MIAASVRREYATPTPRLLEAMATAWALLSGAKRRAILRDTFDGRIWPRLDALGIDATRARAWLTDQTASDPLAR